MALRVEETTHPALKDKISVQGIWNQETAEWRASRVRASAETLAVLGPESPRAVIRARSAAWRTQQER